MNEVYSFYNCDVTLCHFYSTGDMGGKVGCWMTSVVNDLMSHLEIIAMHTESQLEQEAVFFQYKSNTSLLKEQWQVHDERTVHCKLLHVWRLKRSKRRIQNRMRTHSNNLFFISHLLTPWSENVKNDLVAAIRRNKSKDGREIK